MINQRPVSGKGGIGNFMSAVNVERPPESYFAVITKHGLGYSLTVDECPVAASQIFERVISIVYLKPGVLF